MKGFPVGIQLLEDSLAFQNVEKIFSKVREILPFTHVLISAQNPLTLDACVKQARDRGAKIYLWKQVFHKIGGGEAPGQLVALNSEPIRKPWICPNKKESTKSIIEEMSFILNNHDVDGLFIDVFRYPSPYDGLASMLTCFCESCMDEAGEMGVDLEKTRRGMKYFLERVRALSGEEIGSLRESVDRHRALHYLLEDSSISDFFRFRSCSVNHFVSSVKLLTEENGRELGLDVFPPSLSWLVGQDYALLRRNCDWMKPMVYCQGSGPACMPAEIVNLSRELQKLNPRLRDGDLISMVGRFLELRLPYVDLNEIEAEGLPEKLVRLETARAKEAVDGSVPIYSGIEAVVTDICSTSPERVESYCKNAIGGGADGIVVSWDVGLVPRENLEIIRKIVAPYI